MSKKRKNPLSGVDVLLGPEPGTTETDADEIKVSIEDIIPDFDQPRRVLPADIKEKFKRGKISAKDALQEWQNRVDSGEAAPIYINRLRHVRDLAQTIEMGGLIHAIRVRPISKDDKVPERFKYKIGVGEMRFWAHVLLTNEGRMIREGAQEVSPSSVKVAIISEGTNVSAYQIIENIQKESLNAIERAMGYVNLRRELAAQRSKSRDPQSIQWKDVELLVPWEEVDQIVGKSERYRRHSLSVLSLSEEAQKVISELDLPERAVRPLQKLRDSPDMQLKALEAMKGSDSEEGLNKIVSKLLSEKKPKDQQEKESPSFATYHKQFLKPLSILENLSDTDRREFIRSIDETTVESYKKLKLELEEIIKEWMRPRR